MNGGDGYKRLLKSLRAHSCAMSVKSVPKLVRKSDATAPPMTASPDVVRLNFGQLIDLSLGQTENSKNYGAVSFGLLRELLIAIVERMGKCL